MTLYLKNELLSFLEPRTFCLAGPKCSQDLIVTVRDYYTRITEAIRKQYSMKPGLIRELIAGFDEQTRRNFTAFDIYCLEKAFNRTKMFEYPPASADDDWKRASGRAICEICGLTFLEHPMDWRVIEYDHRPYLHVLCSGERVKL